MTSIAHENLTTHRAAASVWDRRGWNGKTDAATAVRWLIGTAGGALALQGIRLRSGRGAVLATWGGALAWWAFASGDDIMSTRRRLTHWFDRWRGADSVDDASADSFPASDAPAWTSTTGVTGARRH